MVFNQMINELNNSIKVSARSKGAYVRYINNVRNRHGGNVETWLNYIINNKSSDPIKDALNSFDAHFVSVKLAKKTVGSYKTAFKHLSQAVLGLFYANVWAFDNSSLRINTNLYDLIANNALFASGSIICDVMKGKEGRKENKGIGNKYASWDNCTHARVNGVKKGNHVTINGKKVIADDNTIANQAIKRAVLLSRGYNKHNFRQFRDYEACHIWDNPQDPNYYASLANLVLVPRAFAGLTDHCQPIKELLRYRAWDLFNNTGVIMACGTTSPTMPKNYSKIVWRW